MGAVAKETRHENRYPQVDSIIMRSHLRVIIGSGGLDIIVFAIEDGPMIDNESWYVVESENCHPLKEKPVVSGKGKCQTEKELTKLLFDHPELIEQGLLPLMSDPEGKGGFDILGLTKQGRFVVVEVKKGSANASTFGQGLGYALTVRNWPVSMIKYRKDIQDIQKPEISRRAEGNEAGLFPQIILVGYNVAGSALQCIRFFECEIKFPNFSVKAVSISVWDSEGKRIVRIRTHTPSNNLKSWDKLKAGDIVQNVEWLDTDWLENPVEIIEQLPDGQLKVQTVNILDGKKRRVGKIKTEPFLANYVSVNELAWK